jgi:hypothetical protein
MLMKEACGQSQREVNGSQAAYSLVNISVETADRKVIGARQLTRLDGLLSDVSVNAFACSCLQENVKQHLPHL